MGEAPSNGWRSCAGRNRLVTAPFGERATRVPITGQVIATTYRDRLPHFDEIWNAPHLFQQAQAYFRVSRGPLPVRVPASGRT